nr:MAG TPA: hypothetical protein [Caudoviricetes sp.]
MRNRFLLVGSLLECAIQYYATHAKIRMALDVNGQTITIQQTISRKWAKEQYAALGDLISYLHPKVKGTVAKNGKETIYTMEPSDSITQLMISGNINEWKGNIYFNGQYMRIVDANMADSISIEVDGQWVDNSRMVNIVGDWPREFHIPRPDWCGNQVYRLRLAYNAGYTIHDGVVDTSQYGLNILSCQPLDEYIDDKQMRKILLELEIMEG